MIPVPPHVQIRPLGPGDAPAFWRLRHTALKLEPSAFGESAEEHERTPVEIFASRLLREESVVIGGFDGLSLVGVVGLHREERLKRRHTATIWGMFVAPSHRNLGLGRALLTAAIERARSMQGVRKVQLSVITSQPAARRLYASLGFRSFGIEPEALDVDGRYLDEEYMYLRLGE